jgi:S1-C subfamily serine protease
MWRERVWAKQEDGKLEPMDEHGADDEFSSLLGDSVEEHDIAPRRTVAAGVVAVFVALTLVLSTGGIGIAAVVGSLSTRAETPSILPPGSFPGHQAPGASIDVSLLDVTAATPEQKRGVVTIVTDLYYDGFSQAAGTGIILSADGLVLTNEHVVEGSTELMVTVESTGTEYSAVVLGSDATHDVALIRLDNASGLETRSIDASTPAELGDIVTSIGNARGTGNLVVATGPVVNADESITVGSDGSGTIKTLDDVIEFDADVVSGDSGGPLLNANGDVVGLVSAASTGATNIRGFAIRIAVASDIVDQILAGDESGSVRIGPRAFFGVELSEEQGDTGVTVQSAIPGLPAEAAGIDAGDIITAVDDTPVLTYEELSAEISSHEPGDVVTVYFTTPEGKKTSVTVTLASGPGA